MLLFSGSVRVFFAYTGHMYRQLRKKKKEEKKKKKKEFGNLTSTQFS